jgi:hypothetical protein
MINRIYAARPWEGVGGVVRKPCKFGISIKIRSPVLVAKMSEDVRRVFHNHEINSGHPSDTFQA